MSIGMFGVYWYVLVSIGTYWCLLVSLVSLLQCCHTNAELCALLTAFITNALSQLLAMLCLALNPTYCAVWVQYQSQMRAPRPQQPSVAQQAVARWEAKWTVDDIGMQARATQLCMPLTAAVGGSSWVQHALRAAGRQSEVRQLVAVRVW